MKIFFLVKQNRLICNVRKRTYRKLDFIIGQQCMGLHFVRKQKGELLGLGAQ
jgi:hypothetical protein